MRRALLLATLLAAPSLAAAQAAGQVLFANSRVNPNSINAFECDPANNAQVLVQWTPQFISGTSTPVGGTYIIYGSNIRANIVLNTNSGATSATIGTSALVSVSGLSCSDGQTLYICVQGVQGGAFNALTNFAISVATVTISTSLPNVPAINGIPPGDRALNVSWEPGTVGTGTGTTVRVEMQVTPLSSPTGASDPGGLRTVGRFGASPARLEGLVNNVIYDVQARALTDADNASAFSPAGVTTGMPQFVNDFWEVYKAAGGRDTGGCSSGLAGPLALGLLIATLALSRRRK